MTILAFLATFSGIFLGLGGLPQAIKIFRRKSAADISPVSFLISEVGSFIWILYGLELKNVAIVLPNVLGCLMSAVILIGYYLYGRKSK